MIFVELCYKILNINVVILLYNFNPQFYECN